MLEMSWHILMPAVLIILIVICAKLVRDIKKPIDDEDWEYFSKWR
jgi:hypothetical protein